MLLPPLKTLNRSSVLVKRTFVRRCSGLPGLRRARVRLSDVVVPVLVAATRCSHPAGSSPSSSTRSSSARAACRYRRCACNTGCLTLRQRGVAVVELVTSVSSHIPGLITGLWFFMAQAQRTHEGRQREVAEARARQEEAENAVGEAGTEGRSGTDAPAEPTPISTPAEGADTQVKGDSESLRGHS
jgi:hypothetical protein